MEGHQPVLVAFSSFWPQSNQGLLTPQLLFVQLYKFKRLEDVNLETFHPYFVCF